VRQFLNQVTYSSTINLAEIFMTFVNEPLLLGVEIGGSKLQLVAGTSPTRILYRQRIPANSAGGASAIRSQIGAALEQWTGISWRAGAVGFGGPVNWSSGQIRCSNQVEGWDNVNLRSWLEDLIGAPVGVENDASLAALAEARHGAGTGFSPVFYTNSGSGVGGGLIINGEIYHGAPPGQAEFGHVRLSPGGPSVEDHCSGWAVDRKIRERCEVSPSSELARLTGDGRGGEARHLADALCNGDSAAQQIIQATAKDLAFALSHVVHLFHPGVIVLGGGLALVGEPWRAAVAEAIPGHLMPAFRPGPEVRLAALGEDVVPVGALALASSLAIAREACDEHSTEMDRWIQSYLRKQCDVLTKLPVPEISALIRVITAAAAADKTIFVIGNGGNAASASHLATDIGKGASDATHRRIRIVSLGDNSPWLTALANDYAYDEIFTRQLMNFAEPGDVLIASSVSGNSPNLVSAAKWARANQLNTIALVGETRGKLAELCDRSIVVADGHYGRVEDAQMTIFHLLAYAFMEASALNDRKSNLRPNHDSQPLVSI
jgi:glucokinase